MPRNFYMSMLTTGYLHIENAQKEIEEKSVWDVGDRQAANK